MSEAPFALTPAERNALPPDGGPHYNRLIFSRSPYLLQHADNPVDWHAWGPEALARAHREEKPIFLSIGYATCHWCHVMAHESFEDEEVAALLNRDFISIKVDREERPDLDHLYMTVTQGMTGRGGWPMTVVLTPDGKPFLAGTYFPARERQGRPGLLELLPRLIESWTLRRHQVVESAEQITDWLSKTTGGGEPHPMGPEVLERAFGQLSERFDAVHGGFGGAPKFPTPHHLCFLLRYACRTGEQRAQQMSIRTLQQMRRGGIWDHLAGGFHRYSTDAQWRLPHFEKMLYDQALIAEAYLDGYVVTGEAALARTARGIFTYVCRDLADPLGGFRSAEDADSEGEEGRFYLWTTSAVRSALADADRADLFLKVYGLTEQGNYREEVSGRPTGRNLLCLDRPLEEWAGLLDMALEDLERELELARSRLYQVRSARMRPLLDDKVLTDWNGLMIAALARGARVLEDAALAGEAVAAARFVWEHLRDGRGRLLKSWRDGEAGLPAHLNDYAFMAAGLVELHLSTREVLWLERAVELVELMMAHFWDDVGGGFFFTADDGEPLLVRAKEFTDGAIPSGNAVAARTMLRLARLTGRPGWERQAERLLEAAGGQLAAAPIAATAMMCALELAVADPNTLLEESS